MRGSLEFRGYVLEESFKKMELSLTVLQMLSRLAEDFPFRIAKIPLTSIKIVFKFCEKGALAKSLVKESR